MSAQVPVTKGPRRTTEPQASSSAVPPPPQSSAVMRGEIHNTAGTPSNTVSGVQQVALRQTSGGPPGGRQALSMQPGNLS